MRRNRLYALVIGVIVLFLNAGMSLGQTRTFVLIGHSSNPVQELSRADGSRLLLRQATRWEDGREVLPVNLVEPSPLRMEFSPKINRKGAAAEEALYQRSIFTGRGVLPVDFLGLVDLMRNLGQYWLEIIQHPGHGRRVSEWEKRQVRRAVR